jgi:hypothetical protein
LRLHFTKQAFMHILGRRSAVALLLPATAALMLVLGHAILYGAVHEVDEGAAAHIFRILTVLQVPVLVVYLARQAKCSSKMTLPLQGVLVTIWACSFAAVRAFT